MAKQRVTPTIVGDICLSDLEGHTQSKAYLQKLKET